MKIELIFPLLLSVCFFSWSAETLQEPHTCPVGSDLDQRDLRRNEMSKESRALDIAAIREGMMVGELGAGDGFFTLMLAQRVGARGRVYANDIVDEGSLSVIRQRARQRGLNNIVTVVGTEFDTKLPRQSCDAVFIVNALHDFSRPAEVLGDLAAVLKENGKVVIVDSENPTMTHERWLSIFAKTPFSVSLYDERSLWARAGRRGVIFILAARK